MANAKPRRPPVLGTLIFVVGVLGAAIASGAVGLRLYTAAGKEPTEFYGKLGELSLQFAVVVIVGAFVKIAVDWGTSQRARHRERIEARKEFLRRVRAKHVAIQNARDLMIAHQSLRPGLSNLVA